MAEGWVTIVLSEARQVLPSSWLGRPDGILDAWA